MRKLSVLFTLVIASAMILSSCAPATPVATDAPGDVPIVAPTEAMPTEAPMPAGPTSPYVGSGKLDGNGVPSDFFADEHIRKGFSYCFDFDTYIRDVFLGEAVQNYGLPLPGMAGYEADLVHYSFDLEKAEAEFKLADLDHDGIPAGDDPEGDVWTTGFRIQMMYNTGNTTRQTVSEIFADGVGQVNELFQVEVLGLPWPAYITAITQGLATIINAGWQEDYHDGHNWYQPYTTGFYGSRQNMPQDIKDQFKVYVDAGVALLDLDERNAVYADLNQLYFDLNPGLPTVVGTSHAFEQKWVQGHVHNPLFPGFDYSTFTKTDDAKDPTTFVSVTSGDPIVLDPAAAYDTASGEIIQNVYDTLVEFDGDRADQFVPELATSWTVSDDGTIYTFNIREGVKFHEGGDLTPSDIAYSFQRGLLQGGYASAQLLMAEPFFGVGIDDITGIVDDFASADDRESLMAVDAATLVAACETVKSKIVADDAAGTVTMTLAQGWGPFLGIIAQGWASVMDMEWVVENGGWDGSCDTWQNTYAMPDSENPFQAIVNGTGPYKMDYWTQGTELAMDSFDGYWGDAPAIKRVVIMFITEFGTRFAMLQAGDADWAYVPVANRPQADLLAGEIQIYDLEKNEYGPSLEVCGYDPTKLGLEKFTVCAEGETGLGGPLRVYIGRPGIAMTVITYNFNIK
ncbi:ABC transporter substrate-binding protein [Chloroflexota bacterium]